VAGADRGLMPQFNHNYACSFTFDAD